MLFTYEAYETLIDLLRKHGYTVSSYRNWQMATRCVILRHDIDYDPAKAIEMAKLEQRLGVQSTYFALLTSDFYNAFSKESGEMFREISACGHEIGLHFDEVRYPELAGDADAVREKIIQECRLLEAAAGREITIVSMHRPSKAILEADLEIPGIINSYGSVYFKGFKYLSDSRRRWREPVEDIISSKAGIVLAAVDDEDPEEKILGTMTLVVFRIPTGVRAWVEDVVVDNEARRRGIGEKLIRASIARAEAEGAKTIDLTSRPTRVEAHRLYKRCGFEIRETCVFRRKLG